MPKRKESSGPGAPLWCLSYGDLVTNMLVFFVMLFAFSTLNATKFEQMAYSFVVALGGGMGVLPSNPTFSPPMPIPPDFIMQGPMTVAELYSNLGGVEKSIQQQYGSEAIEVIEGVNEVRVRISGDLLFMPCSASIRPETSQILSALAPELVKAQKEGYRVYIEGHAAYTLSTCPGYIDDFHISSDRALNVLERFKSLGLDDSKMALVGYGDNVPVGDVNTPQGQAKNRRVEITIRRD
ncbi:OmpA family protein [Coprothermobacter proteolyticus DSM 5265]|uniref:OmpA family protein n=1 Tax=Coprothermobacter proteolyticus (strain ATCC 35245 / DSM 5265 / OCM 4 / BT) TaxID=309798 RepID=B5Y7E7_COPPD|nr:flagellar motor protein MotB [Coprothermobacter proteolyticus]ACI17517.1 OmpA family protein [Coprothermobacter proteolyticus DSM 5265]